ncbi:MAG: hypothetical protein SNH27_17875 [Rikenellaceae bacterium]
MKKKKVENLTTRHTNSIEKAAPIPIGTFIPQEFSEAYCKES